MKLACILLERQASRRTKVHDVVAANGAVVHDNVPSPECYCIPLSSVSLFVPSTLLQYAHLLDLEALLVACVGAGTGLASFGLGRRGILHVYVRHGCDVCEVRTWGECGAVVEVGVVEGDRSTGSWSLYRQWSGQFRGEEVEMWWWRATVNVQGRSGAWRAM